jgi:large subunit ribosomal protein L21
MYAVIRAGGRQYKVAPGDVIEVNRLTASTGESVSFPAVLIVDGTDVKARTADLDGVAVQAEVVEHGRGKKIRVFNYHAKTGWKKTRGHRQDLTTVRITGIG